ncbi:hypothetical protein JTE90_007414 [Oedothorax gibbosus]|uniref:Uncharacterized protein n=1 Tax=Oedothorax gibbosus TaxID=931172 RepID=A0AAV6TQ30_9ARAC|nr:hypothetical protein JTE90_007414 [Oedothorax gibbosus]
MSAGLSWLSTKSQRSLLVVSRISDVLLAMNGFHLRGEEDNQVRTTSKTKVASIKVVSIPKLELNAAVLLTRLSRSYKECSYGTSEILETTSNDRWLFVPSQDNPADIASRGLSPDKLVTSQLWWFGPAFLHSEMVCPPAVPESASVDLEALKEEKTNYIFFRSRRI